jgi:IS1 family transposase
MNIFAVILIIIGLCFFTILVWLFYHVHQYRKWYKRGYNEVKEDVLKWRTGERKDKPFVQSPYYIKKSQFKENNWWYRGAYDAYRESQINGKL